MAARFVMLSREVVFPWPDSFDPGLSEQEGWRKRPDLYSGAAMDQVLSEALELTAEEGGGCGKDETLLFQGPPGAGKTALLEECAVLAAARANPVVVRVQVDEFGSVHGLVQAIDAAVGIRAARRITADLAERGGRIGPAGVAPRRGADPSGLLRVGRYARQAGRRGGFTAGHQSRCHLAAAHYCTGAGVDQQSVCRLRRARPGGRARPMD